MLQKPALLLAALLAVALIAAAMPAGDAARPGARGGHPRLPTAAHLLEGDGQRVVVYLAVRASLWAVDTALAALTTPTEAESAEPLQAPDGRRSKVARPLTPFYSFASALPRARGA